jgi:hypothetical protein
MGLFGGIKKAVKKVAKPVKKVVKTTQAVAKVAAKVADTKVAGMQLVPGLGAQLNIIGGNFQGAAKSLQGTIATAQKASSLVRGDVATIAASIAKPKPQSPQQFFGESALPIQAFGHVPAIANLSQKTGIPPLLIVVGAGVALYLVIRR